MRPRTLLILLALVAGLGAFIWFYERELPSSTEREEQAKKILAVEKDDIQAVTLESGGGAVVLERVEDKDEKDSKDGKDGKDGDEGEKGEETEPAEPVSVEWRMTRPLQARADTFAVDGLLEALTNLEKTRTLDEVDPAQVGLDKPQAVVRLRTGEGERVLQIGSAVPTGGAVIARIQGEKGAHVVSDSILTEIRREPGSWRDRRLFQAEREAVQSIRLVSSGSAGSDTTLVRQGPGFRVAGDPADRERVDELFADLDSLSAETFLDQPGRSPAEMGLAPPQAVVQVALRGRPPVRIELGGPTEGAAPPPAEPGQPEEPEPAAPRYARVDGQLVEVRTGLADLAARSPGEWRSSLLSALEVHQIDSVTVNDGQTTTLTRAGTDWKRGDQMISYVPVSDLLFALTGARADRLLTPAEAKAAGLPPTRPALTFTLQGKETGAETLTLYPAVAGSGATARASGRGTLLLLPPAKLQEIRDRLAAVRKAEPLKPEERSKEPEEQP